MPWPGTVVNWRRTGSYRVYAKRDVVEDTETASAQPIADGGSRDQAGFRADWGTPEQGFTVPGDGYNGQFEQPLFGAIRISGLNLLADWNRREADGSSLRMQTYFDETSRNDPLEFQDRMKIFDFEFQREIPLASSDLQWGGGYRFAHDATANGLLTAFIPATSDLNWENLFAQEEIKLNPDLKLTLGLRLDRNVYTGTEVLPDIRVAWKPSEDQLLWSALSRAVREPSRIDKDFYFPGNPPFAITGGPDFVSELVRRGRSRLPRGADEGRFGFHHRVLSVLRKPAQRRTAARRLLPGRERDRRQGRRHRSLDRSPVDRPLAALRRADRTCGSISGPGAVSTIPTVPSTWATIPIISGRCDRRST